LKGIDDAKFLLGYILSTKLSFRMLRLQSVAYEAFSIICAAYNQGWLTFLISSPYRKV